jgi:hypothetical protein
MPETTDADARFSDELQEIDVGSTGLCADCRSLRVKCTKRGAVFFRCARADEDDRFMRYPPIPVIKCCGFDALD